jgi:Domain of unknown function (DUF4192)
LIGIAHGETPSNQGQQEQNRRDGGERYVHVGEPCSIVQAVADSALDRALADDPRYSMASLLRRVIDSGAPPSLAWLPMTPEEVAASCDALEGPDADDSTAGSAAMGGAPEGYNTYREHGHGGPLRLPAAES